MNLTYKNLIEGTSKAQFGNSFLKRINGKSTNGIPYIAICSNLIR
jgi:hypothetical protein